MKEFLCLLLLCVVGVARGFSVNGNTLYDNNGNPVLLRGIARPSFEWNPKGENISLADFTLQKNWGANAIRLSTNQCYWMGYDGATASVYQTNIDNAVSWIKSLEMAVILDLHWSDMGNNGGCGQQTMADVNSNTFWNAVATKYANDPMILFELYNEPHDVAWSVWRNGDGNKIVGMQNLYNTVRATGANNVVIIGGLNYAYDLSGVAANAVTGTNIMYNTHPYNTADRQDFDTAFGYLTPTYPVIATEYGDTSSCDTSYYTKFITYANQKYISWTGWGWYPQGCGFPSLIADWKGNPATQGVPVQYDLLHTNKVPGNTSVIPTVTSFTATTSTSSVSATSTVSTTGGGTGTGVNLTLYQDAVENFSDGSWATPRNPSDTSEHHSGTASYSWTPSNYNGMYFIKTAGLFVSQYQGLEFWIHGGTSGNQHINFNIVSGSPANKIGPDDSVTNYIGMSAIPANTWVRGFVDFSAFPQGTYDGLWFQSSSSGTDGTVYFDDIVLVAYPLPAASSATTTAAQSESSTSTSGPSTSSVSSTSSQGATASSSTTSQSTTSQSTTSQSTTSHSTTSEGASTTATTPPTVPAYNSSCVVGEYQCPCTEGGGCEEPYTCLSNLCLYDSSKDKSGATPSIVFSLLSFLMAGLVAVLV